MFYLFVTTMAIIQRVYYEITYPFLKQHLHLLLLHISNKKNIQSHNLKEVLILSHHKEQQWKLFIVISTIFTIY